MWSNSAVFVNSDKAEDILSLGSRIHGLIPYSLFRQALKLANPTFLAKTIVNFLFGQPLGQKSVFTRIVTGIFSECPSRASISPKRTDLCYWLDGDIKNKTQSIQDLTGKLSNPKIAEIFQSFVSASPTAQAKVRLQSGQSTTKLESLHLLTCVRATDESNEDMILAILRDGGLPAEEMDALSRIHQNYKAAIKENDVSAVKATSGDIHDYIVIKKLFTYVRRNLGLVLVYRLMHMSSSATAEKRDREEILKVALDPNTPEVSLSTNAKEYSKAESRYSRSSKALYKLSMKELASWHRRSSLARTLPI